jgi:hypothetical protein
MNSIQNNNSLNESFPENKNLEVKKQWIAPEMQEMNINGGAAYLASENSAYRS